MSITISLCGFLQLFCSAQLTSNLSKYCIFSSLSSLGLLANVSQIIRSISPLSASAQNTRLLVALSSCIWNSQNSSSLLEQPDLHSSQIAVSISCAVMALFFSRPLIHAHFFRHVAVAGSAASHFQFSFP